MIFSVKAHPGSSEEKLEVVDDVSFEIWTREPPENGRANRAVERLIAEHFDVPKSTVVVFRGRSSRNKLIKVG